MKELLKRWLNNGDKPKPCKHDWIRITENEAYPALGGHKCIKCGAYKLQWF